MEALIQELIADGYLKTPRIIEAFRQVRRRDFLPDDLKGDEAVNAPLPIGYGQTISQPLTVAIMLELLQPREGDNVLDIGAGSGWTAALFSYLVGPKGKVIAMERVPQLAEKLKGKREKLKMENVTIIEGDGSRGYPKEAPFAIIHVAAAAEEFPEVLKDQLGEGGRLVVPVGRGLQDLVLVRRTGPKTFTEERVPGFQFVPLIEGDLP